MASIHKDGGDATWRAAFSCIVGTARVRVKKTTGTADRKLAGRIADFLEDVAAGVLRPEEIHSFIAKISESRAKRAARRGADEALKLVTGRGLGGDSLRTYAEGWLARTRGEVAGRSIAKYETAVHRFLEMLGTRADLDSQAIEQKDVVFFRDQLAKRLAASSVNSDLKIIRSMFTAAERDLLITRNPARLVRALKVHDTGGERRSFTLAELGRIYAASSGEMRGLFIAGLFTGQRLGDLARLRWANLDFDRGEIRLTTRKTGRRQIIPMATPLRDWLLANAAITDDPSAPVFPRAMASVENARNASVGWLSNQFHGVLVAAGLADLRDHKRKKDGQGRAAPRRRSEVGFHSLRYTATSLMKGAGVSEAVAMDIIGHESEAISAHYTKIDEATKRSALERLPSLDALGKAAEETDRARRLT